MQTECLFDRKDSLKLFMAHFSAPQIQYHSQDAWNLARNETFPLCLSTFINFSSKDEHRKSESEIEFTDIERRQREESKWIIKICFSTTNMTNECKSRSWEANRNEQLEGSLLKCTPFASSP